MLSLAPFLGFLTLVLTSSLVAADQTFRIATYNLRYDSQPDSITVQQSLDSISDPLQAPSYFGNKGERPWSTRRVKVFQHLHNEGVVLAGESWKLFVLSWRRSSIGQASRRPSSGKSPTSLRCLVMDGAGLVLDVMTVLPPESSAPSSTRSRTLSSCPMILSGFRE